MKYYYYTKIFFLFALLFSHKINAETTAGTNTRKVSIDGNVTTGATKGTNNTNWETDEVFQGFNGIVNWYLTWDDNNLYIGKIGGNNAEGAVIYLRANYNGATFSSTPATYDGFSPNTAAMGGINFALYLKSSYDEFRVFSGGSWSASPNTSLDPKFSTQLSAAHTEIAIPWNSITNGNGKPANMRAAMYQIAAASAGCSNVFAYGESPWGNGSTTGASIGTNDGTGASVVQPGGCIAGNSAITRWWGCYPVISGVSANGFVAVAPNAGNDLSICENTTVSLEGNEPSADAIGTWTILETPTGATPTFSSTNNKNATVSGLTVYGTYRFGWSINYGGCPSAPDEMTVVRWQAPSASMAGTNQVLSCETNTTTLAANTPAVGAGRWKLISGSASIADPLNPATTIGNIAYGTSIFQWSIGNGVGNACDSSRTRVQVRRFKSVSVDAGANQVIVDANSTTLSANNPALVGDEAKGKWTQVSGPTTATFANDTLFNTSVSNLAKGIYVFRWTISNGSCPNVSGTVTVEVKSSVVIVPLANEVFVPNSFSPNGDSRNEVFKVFGNNLKEFKLLIFNRLGQEVVALDQIKNEWKGEYKGQILLGETLVWTLAGQYLDGTEFKKKGSVVVLK